MSEEVHQIKITISNPQVFNKVEIVKALESSLARYKEGERYRDKLCAQELASSVFGTPVTVVCVRQEGHHGDHKGEVFWVNEEGGSY